MIGRFKNKVFSKRDLLGAVASISTILYASKDLIRFFEGFELNAEYFSKVISEPFLVSPSFMIVNSIIYVALFILLGYLYSLKKKYQLSKFHQRSKFLCNFISSNSTSPIDDSICGTYFSMRNMAGTKESDKNKYYYTQHLNISKNTNGEFTFTFTGYWNNTDYQIKGSCIRINNNLIFYGSSFGNLDSSQVAMLEYPDGEEDMTGVFSLSRMKRSAAMSTRIIITKLNPSKQQTEYSKDAHARFNKDKLLESHDAISILGSRETLVYMKEYLDAKWEIPGILEN